MLRAEGYAALLGPMDGDTWHAYRVVVESDGSAPFAMEPVSGPHDRAAFEASGFAPVSSYVSTRASLADAIGPEAPPSVAGVTVAPWDGQNADLLIGKLFDMSARELRRQGLLQADRPRTAFLAALRARAAGDRSAPGAVRARRRTAWSASCSACRTGWRAGSRGPRS